jgi:molybdopterin-guanine dinucleotide biosynthesis protein A
VRPVNKCALILADGKEGRTLPSRFGEPSDSTVLEYVLDSVWTVADEIFVVFGAEPSVALVERIAPFGVKAVIGRNGSDPFSLIMAGFRASSSDSCLVVTSDAPFVKPSVLFHLFESIRGFDAAIPKWRDGRTDPLFSVYSRRAVLKAASGLKNQTVAGLVDGLYAACYVSVEDLLRPIDPELESFFRIRTESDLRKAKRIASSKAREKR